MSGLQVVNYTDWPCRETQLFLEPYGPSLPSTHGCGELFHRSDFFLRILCVINRELAQPHIRIP
jgi:hypothetical protein